MPILELAASNSCLQRGSEWVRSLIQCADCTSLRMLHLSLQMLQSSSLLWNCTAAWGTSPSSAPAN